MGCCSQAFAEMVQNRTTRFSQRLSFYLQVKGFSWSWPKGTFHIQAVLYGESQLVSACNNFHSSVNFMVSVISLSLCKIHYHKLDTVCPKLHPPPPPWPLKGTRVFTVGLHVQHGTDLLQSSNNKISERTILLACLERLQYIKLPPTFRHTSISS